MRGWVLHGHRLLQHTSCVPSHIVSSTRWIDALSATCQPCPPCPARRLIDPELHRLHILDHMARHTYVTAGQLQQLVGELGAQASGSRGMRDGPADRQRCEGGSRSSVKGSNRPALVDQRLHK